MTHSHRGTWKAYAVSLFATLFMLALPVVMFAQTATTSTSSPTLQLDTGTPTATSTPTIPGVPNTGEGGDGGISLFLIVTAVILVALGFWYLLTRRTMTDTNSRG